MKKSTSLYCLTLLTALLLNACGGEEKAKELLGETNVDEIGLYFIRTAIESGNKEIAAGKLAEKQATDPIVRNFAKMMIQDHSKAAAELLKMTDKKLVTPIDSLTPGQLKTMDSLRNFTGAQFDKAYMQLMVQEHQQAVKLFKFGTTDRIKTVKDYAEKKLPILQMHLDSAKQINSTLR